MERATHTRSKFRVIQFNTVCHDISFNHHEQAKFRNHPGMPSSRTIPHRLFDRNVASISVIYREREKMELGCRIPKVKTKTNIGFVYPSSSHQITRGGRTCFITTPPHLHKTTDHGIANIKLSTPIYGPSDTDLSSKIESSIHQVQDLLNRYCRRSSPKVKL